jgi:histidine triad (HIT) family protein
MATEPGCPFCLGNSLVTGSPLFANDTCYFLGSIDPILPDAGMIIPYRHRTSPFDLDADEWRDLFELLQRVRTHLSAANPDGYTIGWNVGAAAGQEVMHAHLHVIARFSDEPLAGQGLRHHIKQPFNRRQG